MEARPIARLTDQAGNTIGWVYLWNTSELALLRISSDPNQVANVHPIVPEAASEFWDSIVELIRTVYLEN